MLEPGQAGQCLVLGVDLLARHLEIAEGADLKLGDCEGESPQKALIHHAAHLRGWRRDRSAGLAAANGKNEWCEADGRASVRDAVLNETRHVCARRSAAENQRERQWP